MENYNRRTGVSNVVSNWNRVPGTIRCRTDNGILISNKAPQRDGDFYYVEFPNQRPAGADGYINVENGPVLVEYLIVGGGGRGGDAATAGSAGGGGGGGGVQTGFILLEQGQYDVYVGRGGNTTIDASEPTYILRDGLYVLYASGGGRASGETFLSTNGASTGGEYSTGSTTLTGRYTLATGQLGGLGAGGQTTGGGGGGGAWRNASGRTGGLGFTSAITGSNREYGPGGTGGSRTINASGLPGGTDSGGGGGGAGRQTAGSSTGGDGASGVVIIRWRARGTDVSGVAQRDLVSGWNAVPGTIIGETTTDGTTFTNLVPTRVGTDYVLTFLDTRNSTSVRTTTGRFTVVNQPVWIRYLIVGGGANGGATANTDSAGGGGAGGAVFENRLLVNPGTYTVCVGFRGVPSLILTTDSSFGPAGPQADIPLYAWAPAGSAGGANNVAGPGSKGSGGGSGSGAGDASTSVGNASSIEKTVAFWGYGGDSALGTYGGGGGGGATAMDQFKDTLDPITRSGFAISLDATSGNGGVGATGWSSDITGTTLVYGSGGGGADGPNTGGAGGSGAGNGGTNGVGGNATADRGGGGGGGGRDTLGPYNGGLGASGTVIIRWSVV